MTILEVHNLKKVYTTRFGGNQVQALRNIQFSVEEGEYVAIMGESGSGKTTLLNILAALDRPTEGEVLLNGKNLVTVTEKRKEMIAVKHLEKKPICPPIVRFFCKYTLFLRLNQHLTRSPPGSSCPYD